MSLSVHNSRSEVIIEESVIDEMGFTRECYTDKNDSSQLLPYRQYLANFDKEGAPSLLLFFHGAGSVGTDNYLQCRITAPPYERFFKNHPDEKCVVLLPQCPSREEKWVSVPWDLPCHDIPETPSKYMRLAMELLEEKIREFAVNEKRIYVNGISMGGFAAWDIAARMPERFAGIFPICGGADLKTAPLLKNMKIWCVHGEVDSTVLTQRSRDMIRALQEAGNTHTIYEEVPGAGHNSWDHAYKDDRALEYLFSAGK
ncbi:MAG: phospholipase [Lentisphaeria bacterium]|nr:phospholipase [Lentisphaeria bacterium]